MDYNSKYGYILVTGGAGLIGLNLARRLTECCCPIILFDQRLPFSTRKISNAVYITGDIRDKESLKKIFDTYPVRGIVHLAAVSRVVTAEHNPELCWDVNVSGTSNLFERMLESGQHPWVIFGSSREVYGESSGIAVQESHPLSPVNIYGKSKVAGEELVAEYTKSSNAPGIVLRFSNVYGNSFDHATRVVPAFILQALANRPMEICGGDQSFDFTYAGDIVEGIVKVCQYLDKLPKEEFIEHLHLLTGKGHTLQELAASVASAVGTSPEIVYRPARSYDIHKFYGDPDKASRLIDFHASTSLDEGIIKTVAEFRQKPLRVLKVIHGYPPNYMAGSEVYSYHLARELAREGHEVGVFTRVENPFAKPYSVEDSIEDGVFIRRINNPERDYTLLDKYENNTIASAFENYLSEFKPDVVHIGHLSHLSASIVTIAKKHNIPVVFTLHDFWLFCFRGQMIDTENHICNGPSHTLCMECLRKKFKEHAYEDDFLKYRSRLDSIIADIDHFIAPSEHIRDFFISQGIPAEKITHLRYGFETDKINFRKHAYTKDSPITFGFTGRVIPVKGVDMLIRAFCNVRNQDVRLKIFGSAGAGLPFLIPKNDSRVSFHGGYHTNSINDVLEDIDVLVIPSLWYEVSPLVIQEAFLAGIPVITSDLGGMKELVDEGINGYKIHPGDEAALSELLQKIADDPSKLNKLRVDPSVVLPISIHTERVLDIYRRYL